VGCFVMPLFFAWVCGMSIGYALGGVVWWLVGEVGASTSRNFVSSSLPPCSLRISEALCNAGVNWMVQN
jgi:hypothetical protein